MEEELIERIRQICLAQEGASEKLSHGEPAWFARNKRQFAMLDNHHHGAPNLSVWLAAEPGAQAVLVGDAPDQYFVPPYVGHRGWVGARLDVPTTDWEEIAELISTACSVVGQKRR
ncbi:MAG: MmcQ/YjbR family DNA-binding protein [Fimbriimonas sp.]